jgi:hypothetical protein
MAPKGAIFIVMTKEELKAIEDIAFGKPFEVRPRLLEHLKTIQITKTPKGQRTSSQNASIHLWFRQIADICQNQGVTMNLIIGHTHDVQVTEYGVKALWHVLQKALYGTESTTELQKLGQIDRMVDHFVALFAKEEVELPPFPSNDAKAWENISIPKRDESIVYPEDYKPPLI